MVRQKGRGVLKGRRRQRGKGVFNGRKRQRGKKQKGGLFPYWRLNNRIGPPPISPHNMHTRRYQRGGSALTDKAGRKILSEFSKVPRLINQLIKPIKNKATNQFNKVKQLGSGKVQPLEYFYYK